MSFQSLKVDLCFPDMLVTSQRDLGGLTNRKLKLSFIFMNGGMFLKNHIVNMCYNILSILVKQLNKSYIVYEYIFAIYLSASF